MTSFTTARSVLLCAAGPALASAKYKGYAEAPARLSDADRNTVVAWVLKTP